VQSVTSQQSLRGLLKENIMRRFIKQANLYVGQLVVVSEMPEATVATVVSMDYLKVELRWREGTRLCGCTFDSYMLFLPTLRQIENSIANNGALVSFKEIEELV
jgi:hypothetical protein